MNQATPCPTGMLLPFTRDAAFVGRKILFSQIQDALSRTSTAALVGLGGMGKSQTAVEYAYWCKENEPETQVFWIRASRKDRLQQSFQDIADVAGLPGRDDVSVDKIVLVYDWLYYQQQDPWLLIYDDVDRDIFSSASHVDLIIQSRPDTPRVSQPSRGSILITSRDRSSATRLAGNTACLVDVDSLPESEAVELLKVKLPGDASPIECLDELVRELDCIPLAISQAVSYMGSRLSINDYLLMLRTSETIRVLFLDYEFPDPRRGSSPSNAILKTLWISFESVCSIAPSAAGLLSLFSIYHHQGIPNHLVTDGGQWSHEWEQAVRTLLDFSIIKQCPHTPRFVMHKVVQLSLREWLRLNGSIRAQHEDIERLVCSDPGHLKEDGDWHNMPVDPLVFHE